MDIFQAFFKSKPKPKEPTSAQETAENDKMRASRLRFLKEHFDWEEDRRAEKEARYNFTHS